MGVVAICTNLFIINSSVPLDFVRIFLRTKITKKRMPEEAVYNADDDDDDYVDVIDYNSNFSI